MAEGKVFQVIIPEIVRRRYREEILIYLIEHFSLERVIDIEEKLEKEVESLALNPERGTIEKTFSRKKRTFRFILFRETRIVEIKVIYRIDEVSRTVNVTDFFPTRMDPRKIGRRK